MSSSSFLRRSSPLIHNRVVLRHLFMFFLNYQKQIKTRTALRRPVLSLICIMLHRRHRQRHRRFHSLMPWRVLPSLSGRSIAKQQATAFWNYRANLEKMIHPQLQSQSTRRIFACRQVHTINLNSSTVPFFLNYCYYYSYIWFRFHFNHSFVPCVARSFLVFLNKRQTIGLGLMFLFW